MIKFRDILSEGKYDPSIFKAIFIVGGPGSGKSHTQKLTTSGLGFKVVNPDNEFEFLMKKYGKSLKLPDNEKEERDQIRSKSINQHDKKVDKWIDDRLGLVIDGTGKNYEKIKTQKQSLESIGYDTYMIFVNTNLDVALERNRQRERTLPDQLVKDMWGMVQNNMGKFQSLFSRNNFSIIDKSEELDSRVYEKLWKEVFKFSKKPLSHIAVKWIQSQ